MRLFVLFVLLLAGCSTPGSDSRSIPRVDPLAGAGLIQVESADGVDATYGRLRGAIEANESLSVIAELDHQANAASVGLDLPPTRLILFGNPRAGTPLMQAQPTVGLDLPQKMLVFEDASGRTLVAYNDPTYLATRHGIRAQDERMRTIAAALAGLAAEAAGE